MKAVAHITQTGHARAALARPKLQAVRAPYAGNQARLRRLSSITPRVQAKLEIGAVDDPLEHEADRITDAVLSLPAELSSATANGPTVRRRCTNCVQKEVTPNPRAKPESLRNTVAGSEVPASVYTVLGSVGRPLDASARAFFEPRFGHSFDQVRVHTDPVAQEAARSIHALAYTAGPDIVFGAGQFRTDTASGMQLLAHELAHYVQQSASDRHNPVSAPWIQRAETLGTKVTEPKATSSPFKKVSATFDGEKFILVADGKTIVDTDGQSGHPNQVDSTDAAACKGSPDDTYLNNSRYVGIKDKGPIPEGNFTFQHSKITTFTLAEDAKMALASPGTYADPSGLDLHGDWGTGRAALAPSSIAPAKFCGSTTARSGFYLHGGVMTGSSGCIDIGNSAITSVVQQLMGYTAPVPVAVKYTKPPPRVGALGRAAGRFMYPPGKDAGIGDRLRSVFGF